MPGEPPTQHSGDPTTATQPSDEEMRAAYEAELNRITSTDMILQTAVSLLNIGGRRLGLAAGADGGRDLDQVSDAIDAARALMPILERRMATNELGPLRDALSQLQMAYAREIQSAREPQAASATEPEHKQDPQADGKPGAPGPAESSGRLWVPGR